MRRTPTIQQHPWFRADAVVIGDLQKRATYSALRTRLTTCGLHALNCYEQKGNRRKLWMERDANWVSQCGGRFVSGRAKIDISAHRCIGAAKHLHKPVLLGNETPAVR